MNVEDIKKRRPRIKVVGNRIRNRIIKRKITDMLRRRTIVNKMIAGGKKYLGIPRYNFPGYQDTWDNKTFADHYAAKERRPYYCTNNLPIPVPGDGKKKIELVCYGLTNLMLRHGGVPIPFLNIDDRMATIPKAIPSKYKDLKYGFGGSDEWMSLYYDKIEKFDKNGIYPAGTLLLRNFEPLSYGHTAMLIESSSSKKRLVDCDVLHSAGDALCPKDENNSYYKPIAGRCPGVCIQKLSEQLKYFTPKISSWDKEKAYPNVPKYFDYYQAVLRPEHYIDLDKVDKLAKLHKQLKEKMDREGRQSPGLADLASTVASAFGFVPLQSQSEKETPLKF